MPRGVRHRQRPCLPGPFGVRFVRGGGWGVLGDEGGGIGAVGRAANVFEAPVEGLDAAVVVGGPAAVLVAADFAFKPVHEKTTADSLQSSVAEEKGRSVRGEKSIS